jgi:membrane protein implicated in regulation of membrane protease activity
MELFGFTISSSILWIVIAVVFAVIEALTLGINTIWFTIGAVIASIIAMAGGPVLLQIIAFLVSSTLLIYFTRPIAIKKLRIGNEKTNLDTLPGKSALVINDIMPYSTGQVKVQGQIWTAISDGVSSVFRKGDTVRVLRVEGVKLVVEELNEIRMEDGNG